jgi:hypothetical protein
MFHLLDNLDSVKIFISHFILKKLKSTIMEAENEIYQKDKMKNEMILC